MDGIRLPIKRKAFAYITQNKKLLVFEHPHAPEAGIQVPAGSIEINENPEDGALREAQEETGLSQLKMIRFLGEQIRDMSDFDKAEIHHRYFYHLLCEEETPDTWHHGEHLPSDQPLHNSKEVAHQFRLYWVALDDLPKLIADHDFYVEMLQSLLLNETNTQ